MSRTNITDDPSLTAYALGELSAADRAAVEQQIGESVETLLEIESIREVAGQLRVALGEESLAEPLPTPIRVAERLALVPKLASVAASTASPHKFAGKLAVAASCLALAGAFGIVALSERAATLMARRSERELMIAKTDSAAMSFGLNENGDFRDSTDGLRMLNESLATVDTVDGEIDESGRVALKNSEAGFRSQPEMTRHLTRRLRLAPNMADGKPLAAAPQPSSSRHSRQPAPTSESAPVYGLGEDRRVRLRLGVSPSVQFAEVHDKELRDNLTDDVSVESEGLARSERLSEERSRYFAKLRRGPGINRPELLEKLGQQSAEAYAAIHDNLFASPLEQPLSTFSIDVDTAAYSNMRRFLTQGSWPPADAVRIEELVNYFSYDYAPPADAANLKSQISDLKSENSNQPFATHLEVAACPWNSEHRLVRIGLKGKEIALDKRPVSNVVFLIDVSGSMQDANKLPLVKAGLRRLVDQLGENDRVAIVVYAGASGLALDSTNATQKDVVLSAIENLQAGGSTNGGEGIQLAYTMARKHFIPKGTNRVILCTDGDFNVGITDQEALTRLIEEESKSGVFLSVLGFGMGNLKDATLEKLADKGNGHYAYIDSMREAHKVFVEQMTGTLITIAKDVKIQIEFNPAKVGAYRLIGYENRLMAAQDFHDDTKDAGEIGAGHTVTALYEIIPPDKLPAQPKAPAGEKLKYQSGQGSGVRGQGSGEKQTTTTQPSPLSPQPSASPELLTIKLRYKQPDADKSDLIEQPLTDAGHSFAQASSEFRFAASVAAFGMILRHSPHRGNATLDAVAEIAQSSLGPDKPGHRAEFLGLVRSAKSLKP